MKQNQNYFSTLLCMLGDRVYYEASINPNNGQRCPTGRTKVSPELYKIIIATAQETVAVGEAEITTPCGCNPANDRDGKPIHLKSYQRAGIDRLLRLSFVQQSLCNNVYQVYELIKRASSLGSTFG